MKGLKIFHSLLFRSILIIGVAASSALAQNVRRLTLNPNQDIFPAWNPANNTIAYMRSKGVANAPFDIYAVQLDGTGEGPLSLGPSLDGGLANSPTWIGFSSFLALEERVNFHEYLAFDASQVGFNRTVLDGDDDAFTRLLSIPTGGSGGLIRFSRFGSTALVRFGAPGGAGPITIRTGTLAELVAQDVGTFGTIQLSEGTDTQRFLAGAALSPDGTFFVLAMPLGATTTPNDLFLFPTDKSEPPINLTNSAASGINNIFPDFSPDGTKIIFARVDPSISAAADLYTINLNGSGQQQLTFTPGFSESSPSWSADGTQVTFMGFHLPGRESDDPALLPGEAANNNIYVMDIEPRSEIVTPNTVLVQPPRVEVQGRTVTFTFELFTKALLKLGAIPTHYSPVQALFATPGRKKKVAFRYQVLVERTADLNGSFVQNDIIRKLTKRNSLTLTGLKPGNYSAKYRVQLTKKKNDKIKVIGATDFSPSAEFVIAE